MPTEYHVPLLLLLHSFACLLAGVLSTLLMPRQYRSSPRRTFAHHVLLALFIPGLGMLAVIALALYARAINRHRSPKERPFSAIGLPVFTAAPTGPAFRYGQGNIRSRLVNPELPMEARLKALLAAQALPSNLSTRLLREAMNDPTDDLRLTAYGLLDKGEKRISQLIQQAQSELETKTDERQRGLIHKRLAMLNWELVYQNYTHVGELRAFALEMAERHTGTALALLPDDGELWLLAGRIALSLNQLEKATRAFSQATHLAVPAARILPYLAELAYLKRDFKAVRSLMGQVDLLGVNFTTKPVLAFWNGGSKA